MINLDEHVPSLAHLRDFARARSKGRPTHVASDRLQVAAPKDDRFFAFAYEKFLSRVVDYVEAGNRGGALARAVAESNDRMRPSYTACAKGMTAILHAERPESIVRRTRSTVVLDPDGVELLSARLHLFLETPAGRRGCYLYFSDKPLTEVENRVLETAVGLAVRQVDPSAVPTILMVRAGQVRTINVFEVLAPDRIAFLRNESIAYRAEWAATA